MNPWINYTWPNRLHLIVRGRDVRLYFTLRLWGRRLHTTWRA